MDEEDTNKKTRTHTERTKEAKYKEMKQNIDRIGTCVYIDAHPYIDFMMPMNSLTLFNKTRFF